MIVECSNCQTRFQLDDSRVPERGIRVRCSRCKESFFLEHPSASPADAIQDVAEQSVSGAVAPDVTQELEPDRCVADGSSDVANDDEEDWEFNDEPIGIDASDASADVPDASDRNNSSDTAFMDPADDDFEVEVGDLDEDTSAQEPGERQVPGLGIDGVADDDWEDGEQGGLDLDADPSTDLAGPEEQAVDPDPNPGEAGTKKKEGDARDESAFGDMSDFSQPVPAQQGVGPGEATPPIAAPVVPLSAEDVGEPEDWDFFSDESLEQPGTFESMDNAMERAMAAVEADPTPRVSAQRGPDPGRIRVTRSSRSGLRSLGNGIGWMVTVGLLAVGVSQGVFHMASPGDRTSVRVVELGDFRAQEIRGSWLETARSTQLYAVTGQLVNHSEQARWLGTRLSVALLSSEGDRIEAPVARAGAPIPEAQLRELTSEDLRLAVDQSLARFASRRLEPGEAATFQAVFDGVPDLAANFTLELTAAPLEAPPELEALPGPERVDAVQELSAGSEPSAGSERALEESARTGSFPAPSG